jgi:hypothetical protein
MTAAASAVLLHAFGLAKSHTQAAIAAQRRAARALAAVPDVPPDAKGRDPVHRRRSAAGLRALEASVAYAQAARVAEGAYWDAVELVEECGWLVGVGGPGTDADEEMALLWDAVEAEGVRK